MNIKLSQLSLIFASLALPLAFLIGALVTLILKSNNPDNVDITADLAYLRPTLLASYTTFGLCAMLSAITGFMGLKTESRRQAKFSLITLTAIIMLAVAGGLIQKQVDSVEADYSKESASDIFKPLREQQN